MKAGYRLYRFNKPRSIKAGYRIVVAPGQQGQGTHYNYKNQFSKLEGTNKKIQVL